MAGVKVDAFTFYRSVMSGDEGIRPAETEKFRDFEATWPAVDCFDAPDIIADLVFQSCARDMPGLHPEELRRTEPFLQEDVVVRAIFEDVSAEGGPSLLMTKRFTRKDRLYLKVLEEMGVRSIRRKFPGGISDVRSLTDDANWIKFWMTLDDGEKAEVRRLWTFWKRIVGMKPGDGTLLGIGGKPHTDRVNETLGVVLAAEIGEELVVNVEGVAADLVIPVRDSAYDEMVGMVQTGEDRYVMYNEAMKRGLISVRPRLLGVTLMYVEGEGGGVSRILYVVNTHQEGNIPPTNSYSYDAIQGVLTQIRKEAVVAGYPHLGPELAGRIGSGSREILMKALAGEGWFTRIVRVDPAGMIRPWGEGMELVPYGE